MDMVALVTAASFANVMLPSQHYATKGIKRGNAFVNFNIGEGPRLGVKKHACYGGLKVKANAQNYNADDDDDKFSRVIRTSIRNKFTIRVYEVDASGKASIETLMNYYQSSILDHFKKVGVHDDVSGSTKEMIKKNLIWVYSDMQVATYRFPKWEDEVEVESWICAAGINGVRFNWILRDFKTNQVLNIASSVCVAMNKLTRRLSKIPEEVRREFESHLVNSSVIIKDDNKKIPKLDETTADYICSSLRPRWSDLDVHFHVNNANYVSWILESIPESILMNFELSSMSLKFKRECGIDSKLQSLAAICRDEDINNNVECNHMLRFEDGVEILRGRTNWRPKSANSVAIFDRVPAQASINAS
ncbi:hypothetical protein PIB30_008443 [Stylosanthes scabra]|uniref:Acyl-[acyl-carrier-protein] hydrolase n=1 Tax=Stylosanthes scabra TaxID=79078 RepID=A0ABU6X3Y4_9FABA|nr:hypothetical protein [Stylosanthes scabra]